MKTVQLALWTNVSLAAAIAALGCGAREGGAAHQPAEVQGAQRETDAQAGPPDWIDLFGTTEGKPVDAGFVFVDGRYVEAPYRVCRRGLRLYVNDARLGEHAIWPPDDYEDKDPGVPPGLTRNSTFADLDFKDKPGDSWDRKKARWLRRHYPPEEAQRLIVRYFEGLPFVAKVEVLSPGRIRVTTHAGKTEVIGFAGAPYVPPTKEQVLAEMERQRKRLEGRLLVGDCFFLFSDSIRELCFGRQRVAADLPLAVEVLSSSKTAAEKADLLERMGILPSSTGPLMRVVTGFQPSAQLNQRVRDLARETRIKPRTMQEIPAEPPWKTEERMIEEAMKRQKKE